MPKFPDATDHGLQRRLWKVIRIRKDDRLPMGIASVIIGMASLLLWAIVILLAIHLLG